MKKRITIILLVIFSSIVNSECQKIISNGNFERLEGDSIVNWKMIAGSPDIINLNNLNKDYVWETNKRFFKGTRNRVYIGFAFDHNDSEVFGTKLPKPLTKDSVYRLTIRLLAGHSCTNGFEKVTIGLTSEELDKSYHPRHYEINVAELTNAQYHITGGEWTELIGNYKSAGDEKYISLGNFNHANKEFTKGAQEIVLEGEHSYSCNYLIIDSFEITKRSINNNGNRHTHQEVIIVEDLVFEFGKWNIKEKHYQQLNETAEKLKKRSGTITITGHTDNVGTKESNLVLSTKRANAIKNYFVKIGLKSDQFIVQGNGEESPKYSNDTELGRTNNRRVEIK